MEIGSEGIKKHPSTNRGEVVIAVYCTQNIDVIVGSVNVLCLSLTIILAIVINIMKSGAEALLNLIASGKDQKRIRKRAAGRQRWFQSAD